VTHQDRVAAAVSAFLERHPRGQAPGPLHRRGTTPEGRLLRHVQEALRAEPDLVLWRNSVGVTEHDGRRVTYGLALGSSDLIGILGSCGRFLAFEVKAPTGRLTEHQVRFLERVRQLGGFACVVRSVEEARAALGRAREGARSCPTRAR
jgi:VRR-NUC domain